jgi:hypothetical protein
MEVRQKQGCAIVWFYLSFYDEVFVFLDKGIFRIWIKICTDTDRIFM